MRVLIVLVNYRTPGLTIDCLRSLQPQVQAVGDAQVVVVDNASGDGSADQIQQTIDQQQWSLWAGLIRSQVNGGFSAGNNIGIQSAKADAYLLLNTDTLVEPGAIAAMLDALDRHPKAGIVGPRLQWPDGQPQISCFNDPSPISELLVAAGTGVLDELLSRFCVPTAVSDQPTHAQWLSFAAVIVRRQVIELVGPMDDGYFMYFEDIDYCRRARKAGWDVLYWPDARVVHLRGGTSPVKMLAAQRKRHPRYYYAARARYFAKFYTRFGLWSANALWMLGRVISWLRELLRHKQPHTWQRQGRDNWTNAWSPLRTDSHSKSSSLG